jgi:D-alanyl-D-alanine carboxypeptidase
LLANRRRRTARNLGSALIAFLVLGGTSALASNGSHRSLPVVAIRLPGATAPRVKANPTETPAPPAAISSPGPHPSRTRSFSSSWLATRPAGEAPAVNGRAAIAVDVNAGQILYARDVHSHYPDASLTKMMTAIVALDLASSDQVLTVSPSAIQVEPNVMGLSAGERLSVRELVYGLLLDSGNDAAETIAQGIIDRSRFVQRMNQKATTMHLTDTQFTNPSGFDEAKHYSSAYDLAVMATTLFQDYPELAAIVSTKQVTLASGAEHKWFGPQNLNRLLWSYPGTVGVKPGYTDGAGYCLAAAASRGGRTIVAVVLGSTQHFTDATTLLDFGFRHPTNG